MRKLFGLTALELSEMIDVSTEYISLVERGERSFSNKNLVKLSECFNTSLDYLILGKSAAESVGHETDIIVNLSQADYVFIIKLCKILINWKFTESELDYFENLIKCYLKFRTEKEKGGK